MWTILLFLFSIFCHWISLVSSCSHTNLIHTSTMVQAILLNLYSFAQNFISICMYMTNCIKQIILLHIYNVFLVLCLGTTSYIVFQYNSVCGCAFLMWDWPSTGTGCPGSLWSLLLRTHLREIWKCTWETGFKWPFVSRRIGPSDVQRYLLILTIKLFCDKPFIPVLTSNCSATFRI